MTHSEALTRNVEGLYRLLESIATGGQFNEDAYRNARQEVLNEPILSPMMPRFIHTCRDIRAYWQHIKGLFATYQERRDYLRGVFVPILERLASGYTSPASQGAEDTLAVIDAPHVQDVWRSAYERQEDDPDGAITSARALLESVCKFILDKAGESYDDSWDLPRLYKASARRLNLAPDQHADPIVKQILGGCQTVVEGLGALRNKYGDAHGKGVSSSLPSTRHSALAVNLAGSTATFLVQTYEEKGLKL
jgi:hypothetical protein